MEKRSLKEIQESRSELLKNLEGLDVIKVSKEEFADMVCTIGVTMSLAEGWEDIES